jgi:hypothetical protein
VEVLGEHVEVDGGVRVERTMTFDDIGKEFTGKNSQLAITVHNGSKEQISLRRGTRFVNQAGMVFKLQSDVIISAGANKKVKTLASDVDQFGEIIGERGNVPAGIKWEIPGLEEDLRASVYGRNDQPGVGGSTSYRNVLKREDLEVAKKKIEQDLLIAAKQLTSEERDAVAKKRNVTLTELDYDELTRTNYTNIKLPEEFVGQHVASVPVSGTIFYTVLLYDPHQLFSLLKNELFTSVGDQKVMEEASLRGKRTDLTGGGLIRSMGGVRNVMRARRGGEREAYDSRILGSGEFVQEIMKAVEVEETVQDRLRKKGITLNQVAERVAEEAQVSKDILFKRDRTARVSKAKALFIHIGVEYLGRTNREMALMTKMGDGAATRARQRGDVIFPASGLASWLEVN